MRAKAGSQLLVVSAVLLLICAAGYADTIHVGAGETYTTVQAGIAAASAGDTVLIDPGTYTVSAGIGLNNSITIAGAAGGALPVLQFTGSAYDSIFTINANNISIQNLELEGTVASSGYLIYNPGHNVSGLTVTGCTIHDCRRPLELLAGNNVTVTNCNIYHNYRAAIDLEGGGWAHIAGNWIHDTTYTGGDDMGILLAGTVASSGGLSTVAYNYITGERADIVVSSLVNGTDGSGLLIDHNTLASTWSGSAGNQYSVSDQGIGLYTGGTPLDGANITISNDLVYGTRWYGLYTNGLSSATPVSNSLFFNNYSDPSYSGGGAVHYANEWPTSGSVQDQVGWPATGSGFAFTSDMTQDPLLNLSGTTPQSYFTLNAGSPALGTGTGGTNIGAWQGSYSVASTPEIAPVSLLLSSLWLLVFARRRKRS